MDYIDQSEKTVVYINSAERITGYSDDFTINISNQIEPGKIYNSVCLLSCSIPKSYYIINNNNKTIRFIENVTNVLCSLDVGNFSASELASEISSAMTAASTIGAVYSTYLNMRTGKYYIQTSSAVPTSIDFTNDGGLHEIVGFDEDIYNFNAQILYAPNVCNLQLSNVVRINSSIVGGSDQILSEVIPDNISFSSIVYNEQNAGFASKPMNNIGSDIFSFTLLDAIGKRIDLNGLNWNAVLVLYNSNDYYKKMLNLAQLNEQEKNINQIIQQDVVD